MLESRLEIMVRPTEIDINGHVNNAKYLEYLEWGREDWYERADLPYESLKNLDVVTMTVHVDLNYRREARQGDCLTVITRPARIGNSSFDLAQTVVRERDDALIADAIVTLVTVDVQSRKGVRVPDAMRQKLNMGVN